MKRRTLLRRLAATGLALVLAGPGAEAASPTPKRVYLVAWRGWEDACQGFKDYFTNQRSPVEIVFRDAARDLGKLPEFVREAEAMGVDLVVTWGTSVTLGMLGTYDDHDPALHVDAIPSVFMIVSQPVEAKVVPDMASSGRNVTGTSYLVPEETQLRVARSYRPFNRLGIIYNPKEQNSVINVERLQALANREGFDLLPRPVPMNALDAPDMEAIPLLVEDLARHGIEWLYQGPDSFLNVNRDLLTEAAVARGVPVFAAGENPVRKSHALLGVVNRYYNVGQLAAYKAEQILFEGKNPKDLPIEAPSRFSLIVNMEVAKDLELYPPITLLEFAEVIGGGTP